MHSVIRFGSYEFNSDDQSNYSDNFGDLVPRTARLPGVSGGYNEYGDESPPSEVGTIRFDYWLFADTPDEMVQKVDALRRTLSVGQQRLFIRPFGSTEERFCFATMNNIPLAQSTSERNERQSRFSITLQVPEPFWLKQGTESWSWGDGTSWGSAPWGGSALPNDLSGMSNTVSIDVSGNAPTYPRIDLQMGAGGAATNVRVQRLEGGVVVDEVRYDATLAANDRLLFDCRALNVTLNGANAYNSDFSYLRANWFRLMPGANTIRVLFDSMSGTPQIYFRYYEVYR